jgi:pimeloyl-ACP methyl ester carboxylesterase
VRTTLRLARWLGPWTAPTEAPGDVAREEFVVAGPPALEAWVYRPLRREIVGSVLLVPGLHFLGPRDPRLDRFARVLAHAGHLVFAPFLPTYLRLEVTPAVLGEIERALDALLAHPLRPRGRAPGLMSISFGSMPALRLAARRGDDLANVLIFGGFADFRRTLRFALRGEGDRPNDPLNAPAVVTNLLPFLGPEDGLHGEAERERLRQRLLAYCARTWGRPEMKVDRAYVPHAQALAADLDEPLRGLFLRACRVEPGIEGLIERALSRSGSHFDWIDPRPALSGIRRPVTLVHGVTDDVIPFEESRALLEALSPHTEAALLLTGLYGHTHVEGVGHGPRELAGELVAMGRILHAMASLSDRDDTARWRS